MTVENTEIPAVAEDKDKDPIFFVPKRISMVSDTANILSWIILAVFIGEIIVNVIILREQLTQLASQGTTFSTLLHQPSLYSYFFTNMIIPLFTGLGFFALLQAASLGLSMLLESDYNMREAKNVEKA